MVGIARARYTIKKYFIKQCWPDLPEFGGHYLLQILAFSEIIILFSYYFDFRVLANRINIYKKVHDFMFTF